MVDIDWVCGTCGSVKDEKLPCKFSTETFLSITDVGEDCPMITHLLLNGRYDCGSSFPSRESFCKSRIDDVEEKLKRCFTRFILDDWKW
jgi:hypothetical protein